MTPSAEELFAVPTLRFLSDELLAGMAAQAKVTRVRRGTTIYRTGAPGDALFIVRSGAIELVTSDERQLQVAGAGEAFGELAVFSRSPRGETARARTDAELIELPAALIDRALDDHPLYGRWVIRTLAQELSATTDKLTGLVHDLHQAAFLKLAQTAESYDKDTANHIQRMSRCCAQLGIAVGMGRAEAEDLLLASMLHDFGKAEIDEAILKKPGKLTDKEFAQMQLHPVIGTLRLADERVPLFQLAARIAKTHHERWDGSGYPEGLKGERIPIEGRIAAVADVFDALTSRRPYKEPWPVDRAVRLLREEAGKHFDPQLVEAFVSVLPAIEQVRRDYPDTA